MLQCCFLYGTTCISQITHADLSFFYPTDGISPVDKQTIENLVGSPVRVVHASSDIHSGSRNDPPRRIGNQREHSQSASSNTIKLPVSHVVVGRDSKNNPIPVVQRETPTKRETRQSNSGSNRDSRGISQSQTIYPRSAERLPLTGQLQEFEPPQSGSDIFDYHRSDGTPFPNLDSTSFDRGGGHFNNDQGSFNGMGLAALPGGMDVSGIPDGSPFEQSQHRARSFLPFHNPLRPQPDIPPPFRSSMTPMLPLGGISRYGTNFAGARERGMFSGSLHNSPPDYTPPMGPRFTDIGVPGDLEPIGPGPDEVERMRRRRRRRLRRFRRHRMRLALMNSLGPLLGLGIGI